MMDLPLDTIKIKHPTSGSYMLINAADYNPALHELWEDEPKPKAVAKKTKTEPPTLLPADLADAGDQV